jgi:hypothetical protein
VKKILDIPCQIVLHLIMHSRHDSVSKFLCFGESQKALESIHRKFYKALIVERPSGLCYSGRYKFSHRVNRIVPVVSNGILRLTERVCLDRHSNNPTALKVCCKPLRISVKGFGMTVQNIDTFLKPLKTIANLFELTGSFLHFV